jgi:hypothetical protein
MTMLTKSKLAIVAAALVGIVASATATQAQTIVDPYPTTAPDRASGLPTDPYPNGYPVVSAIRSVRPDAVADLGRTYAKSGSQSQSQSHKIARVRQRQRTATSVGRDYGTHHSRQVVNLGWY